MVNLETAVTEGGVPVPGKEFVFRAPSSALKALDAAGVDVATVANNHGMDYGESGLLDTLEAQIAEAVALVGAGRDIDEAYTPHVAEVNGQTVALFGATDVMDDHLIPEWTAGEGSPGLASTKGEMRERMLEAVSEAADEHDEPEHQGGAQRVGEQEPEPGRPGVHDGGAPVELRRGRRRILAEAAGEPGVGPPDRAVPVHDGDAEVGRRQPVPDGRFGAVADAEDGRREQHDVDQRDAQQQDAAERAPPGRVAGREAADEEGPEEHVAGEDEIQHGGPPVTAKRSSSGPSRRYVGGAGARYAVVGCPQAAAMAAGSQ